MPPAAKGHCPWIPFIWRLWSGQDAFENVAAHAPDCGHSAAITPLSHRHAGLDPASIGRSGGAWRRDWKIALIQSANPDWHDLAPGLGLAPLPPCRRGPMDAGSGPA